MADPFTSSSPSSVFPSWRDGGKQADRMYAFDQTEQESRPRATSQSRHSRKASNGLDFLFDDPALPGSSRQGRIRPGNAQQMDSGQLGNSIPPVARRKRMDSLESRGSSVMPAALPRMNNHLSVGYQPAVVRHRERSREPFPVGEDYSQDPQMLGAGLNGWLRSQNRTDLPDNASPARRSETGSNARYQSFAPSGRVRRRVESETGSTGEGGGSVGGWSNGVMSASGRSRRKDRPREGTGRMKAAMPLWEGDVDLREKEEPQEGFGDVNQAADAGTDSVIAWRNAAVKVADQVDPNLDLAGPRIRKRAGSVEPSRKSISGSTRAPSLAGSAFPPGLSARTMRGPLDTKGSTSVPPRPDTTPLRTFVRGMMKEGLSSTTIISTGLMAGLLVKWAIAAGGWSGTPRAGWDRLRHWMALTLHVPPDEWYSYDVGHLLLDRPPLMAWYSKFCGSLAAGMPSMTKSLAFPPTQESQVSVQTFMRLISLASWHLFYAAPLLLLLNRRLADRGRRTKTIAALTILLQPAGLLVDFGLGDSQHLALGLACLSLALLYSSLPNADQDESEVALQKRADRIVNLSRRVSYDYIAALALYLGSLSLDQSALCFAPVVVMLILGRWAGLTSVGLGRGTTLLMGVAATLSIASLLILWPWLSPTLLPGVFARLTHSSTGLHQKEIDASPYLFTWLERRLTLDTSNVSYLRWGAVVLATFYPCLVVFRAAKETVKLEMHLNEDLSARSKASPVKPTSNSSALPPSTRIRTTSSIAPSETGRLGRASVNGDARARSKRAASVAPSDAGSDLHSLAASIVRGGVDAPSEVGRSSSHRAAGLADIDASRPVASSCPSPSAAILPYATLAISLAVFLCWPSTSSDATSIRILFPLLPLTLLIVAKGDDWSGGSAKVEWEWAVIGNNVAAFSLWLLIRRDGLPLQYICLVLLWNHLIGYRPFSSGATSSSRSFVQTFGLVVHAAMLLVHAISLGLLLINEPPLLLPALVNIVSTSSLVVIWLWSVKRLVEVAVGNGLEVGLSFGSGKAKKTTTKRN